MKLALALAFAVVVGATPLSAAAEVAPEVTEGVIHATPSELWKIWSTPDGPKRLGAARCDVDFRIGGLIRTAYDPNAELGGESTIQSEILAYERERMIAFRIHQPPKGFPFPNAWRKTWSVVTLTDMRNGDTFLHLAESGYDTSAESRKMREFFRANNEYVLKVLQSSYEVVPGSRVGAAPARDLAVRLAAEIRTADYGDDREALQRLFSELEPLTRDSTLGSAARYWRGFALWRRAFNGFNDSAGPAELERDLRLALGEFDSLISRDSSDVEARTGALSCLSNLMFLGRADTSKSRAYMRRVIRMSRDARKLSALNPRLCWVWGAQLWYLPAAAGGGEGVAMAIYREGLQSARELRGTVSDPLLPSWGEPELLMNLAWAQLNRQVPDLGAAEENARTALKLVPGWHYVRDILLPQIEHAKGGKK